MLTAYFDLFVEKRNELNLNCLDIQITFNFTLKIIVLKASADGK
jgi:hypothetical protein